VAALVALVALSWSALSDRDRWPWVCLVLPAAIPFLAMLVPEFRSWLRGKLSAEPRMVGAVPAALITYGVVVTLGLGTFEPYKLLLWPVCGIAAAALLTRGRSAEPEAALIVVSGLLLAAMAGVYERALTLATPGGRRISLSFFLALDLALFLFAAVRPMRSFDIGLGLSVRHLATALAAFTALALVALPLGLAIGFLDFRGQGIGLWALSRWFGLFLFVGLPEEIVFRGLLQEGVGRLLTPRAGWVVVSVLFGLAHLKKHSPPLNWPYALMATLAGLAYGWVYLRTGRIAASATTHATVDFVWGTFLVT
jgi:membrane protease YdiL (CAAX protease family)